MLCTCLHKTCRSLPRLSACSAVMDVAEAAQHALAHITTSLAAIGVQLPHNSSAKSGAAARTHSGATACTSLDTATAATTVSELVKDCDELGTCCTRSIHLVTLSVSSMSLSVISSCACPTCNTCIAGESLARARTHAHQVASTIAQLAMAADWGESLVVGGGARHSSHHFRPDHLCQMPPFIKLPVHVVRHSKTAGVCQRADWSQ
jgi:hypothetical protein